jgi:hypothetical protein
VVEGPFMGKYDVPKGITTAEFHFVGFPYTPYWVHVHTYKFGDFPNKTTVKGQGYVSL